MKKLWILVAALALLGGAAFADVTVAGNFAWYTNTPDFASGTSSFVKTRVAANAAVDDFTKATLMLEASGSNFPGNVTVRDFYVKSDIMGALGVEAPVSVNATLGRFGGAFGGYYPASSSGWEWGSFYWLSRKDGGALQLDVGFGPATLHIWNSFPFDDLSIGVDASLMDMISAWLAYKATVADLGGGKVALEAKFEKEISVITLMVPAYFRYDLGASSMEFGGGLNVSYGMFMVAAGLGGTDSTPLNNMAFEAKVTPMDGLFFDVAGYVTGGAFSGVVIEAQKTLGAASLILGYVVGIKDAAGAYTDIPVNADDTEYGNGLYGGVTLSF